MLTNHQVFVISAPSGGGKKTVIDRVLEWDKSLYLTRSFTTRPRYSGDSNEYIHVTVDEFKKKIQRGCFAEWEEVLGHYYGTPSRELFLQRRSVVEIEVNGARKLKVAYPDYVHTIFLLPTSPEVLEERLRSRGRGEGQEEIQYRLTRAQMEVDAAEAFDHWVTNNDLKDCAKRICTLIAILSLRRQSQGQPNVCRDIDELNKARKAFGLPEIRSAA